MLSKCGRSSIIRQYSFADLKSADTKRNSMLSKMSSSYRYDKPDGILVA